MSTCESARDTDDAPPQTKGRRQAANTAAYLTSAGGILQSVTATWRLRRQILLLSNNAEEEHTVKLTSVKKMKALLPPQTFFLHIPSQ